jgi:glycosyltransferase involved in cell wall biosynthesis
MSSSTSPPTVLWLHAYAAPYGTRPVAMIKALDRQCRELGYRFECGYPLSTRERPWVSWLEEAGIPVSFAPDGRRARAQWLADRLDELPGPAILHTHFAGFDLAAVAACRGREQAASVWHMHSFLRRDPVYVARSVLKFALARRRVSRIVCVGESVADAVRQRGAPRDRTVVVENGIEVDRFQLTTPEQRRAARESLGIAESTPVLLHFGRDWGIKGGELYTESLARLRARGVPAVGLVVGASDEYRAAASRSDLAGAVVIADPSEDVRRFYDASDLFVATSRAEGAPMAIVEALSCGVAVVATDIPGHRFNGTGEPAVRLAPEQPERVAELAEQLLGEPAPEQRARSERSHDWVLRERSMPRWVERMSEVYAAVFAELASGRG